MENTHCKKYFAASNSVHGFVNYFSDIFDQKSCSRIYIIKGGPGTGKSRFMNDAANEAESRGLNVTRYYCSSDANSLDGIIIDEMKTGILDGTAPHMYEPKLVGACEQIVDLGAFWNQQKLSERRDEIANLMRQKSDAYRKTYSLLAAYGKMIEVEEELTSKCIDRKKLLGAVDRWLHKLPEEKEAKGQIGLCRAVGMNGKSKFDTYEKNARLLFTVTDTYHISHYLMNEIVSGVKKRNNSYIVSYDPLLPNYADAVCLPNAGITFTLGTSEERKINVKRFVNDAEFKAIRSELKKIEAEAKRIEELAILSFAEIKKYHFTLEEIYMSAMDFHKKEEYTKNFLKKTF